MEYLTEIYLLNEINDNTNRRTAQDWVIRDILEHEKKVTPVATILLSVVVVYERSSNFKLEAGAVVPD
jgi:hypothetical protein